MKDLTWPTDRMARLIDVSPRRLQQLVQEGIVPKASDRGRYNPVAVTQAYIRYLRDRVQSHNGSDGEFSAERLRKLQAERGLLEFELAKQREEVIDRDRLFRFLENVFVAIREKILGSHLSHVEQEQILNDLVRLKDRDDL